MKDTCTYNAHAVISTITLRFIRVRKAFHNNLSNINRYYER